LKELSVNNASVRLLVIVGLLTLALAAFLRPGGAKAATDAPSSSSRLELIQQIDRYRTKTWHWQKLMGHRRTPTLYTERRASDEAYHVWVRNLWLRRYRATERLAFHPPHHAGWLCIHRYEQHPAQGWATRTGNGYYGGLQMDLSFQRAYGPELLRTKGTADRWTSFEQMWVAERAYRSGRGYYPWPNTARSCGLI
jgi:hypothetical protein